MSERIDFSALERIKTHLAAIRRNHLSTLSYYVSEPLTGFWHQPEKKFKSSLSSTATCVSSLVRANLWGEDFPLNDRISQVAGELIRKSKSAGLKKDNPFSLAFVAEGVLDLLSQDPNYKNSKKHSAKIKKVIAPKLVKELMNKVEGSDKNKLAQAGSISIMPYPPSSYLTQLVFRVLQKCGCATSEVIKSVHRWARSEINKQVSLIGSGSRIGDPLQLAFALILAVTTVQDDKTSPEDKEIFRHALLVFFNSQKEDGTWPLSRPLFHYPEVGNAYCFEYELLTQLLVCRQLWDDLLNYIPNLERAATFLAKTSFDLDPIKPGTVIGWASGHHPQLEGPESWSTASVYDFAFALDRLVAEGIRRALFEELRIIYSSPPSELRQQKGIDHFAPKLLNADLIFQGRRLSLRKTIFERFLDPIASEADNVRRGGRLSDDTPMSAIFFGPPGTSKTQLARLISDYLEWPLVQVDPSYLVQEGLDRVQAMANKLFNMFTLAEQVVVLLDEFDELGRNREGNDDMLSRFITTAMLPKLASINSERKIVFLLATNYVSQFDAAFRRGGRFDMLVQIMPPNLAAKLKGWPILEKSLATLKGDELSEARVRLADLTFLETKLLAQELSKVSTKKEILDKMDSYWEGCTLNKPNDLREEIERVGSETAKGKRNWKNSCNSEAVETRLPAIPTNK